MLARSSPRQPKQRFDDPAFARHAAILPDRAVALPLSAGQGGAESLHASRRRARADLNDILTQGGFRRCQTIAYRPACETCRACVSVRVVVDDFEPSRNMRRIAERNTDLVGDCANRRRPRSSIRSSAAISMPATATAAWPT